MAQCPTETGKGPEGLFEDMFSFFKVVEAMLPTGPAMDFELAYINS